MGKFSDKFLNAFSLKDDDYDDEYDDEEFEDEDYGSSNDKKFFKTSKKAPEPEEEPEKRPAFTTKAQKPVTGRRGSQEVCVFKPTSIDDSREVTETLLQGKAVIINFEGLHVEISQRIIDFISGACYALDGNLQKVSNYIFIATPKTVDITGDFQELLGDSFDVAGFKSPIM